MEGTVVKTGVLGQRIRTLGDFSWWVPHAVHLSSHVDLTASLLSLAFMVLIRWTHPAKQAFWTAFGHVPIVLVENFHVVCALSGGKSIQEKSLDGRY